MRKIILLLFILSFSSNCDQPKNEEKAIIELLNKEATTWRAADSAAHSACWVVRPYGKIKLIANGKCTEIPALKAVTTSKNDMGKGGKAFLSNFKFNIQQQAAQVIHNELSIDQFGDSTLSYEIRELEKVQGEWKLVGQTIRILPKK